ncbi:hypothetical protein J2809_002958 [Arthrobacter pascens]|jgi:hypothetical protein|uniref:DUF1206 domain-containing protein n=1 Tax=Arthrobacter pascens TaxID=1677 RepID=UPI00285C713A|nr:DUF1206 domain-containing protein [Arthrobacter pascens]MDR6558588.1 hypothetical protein [Arthrobacter pascens]
MKRELKDAANAVEDASNSRALVIAARAGFAVSGLLHLLVGFVAIQLALGKAGQSGPADQAGAVAQLAAQPQGLLLLWAGFAACVALALWQTSNAVFDYGQLEARKKVGKKLSAAGKAVVFAVIALTFAASASGNSQTSGQSTSDFTVAIIKAPGGAFLLIAVGAAIAIAGLVFVVLGVKGSFKKELRLPPSGTARSVVTGLGVVGYIAEGVALFLVGLLFIISTVNANPRESTGLDGGLRALREQPYGVYMLTAVGAGLICYGLYLMVKTKFARM